MTTYAPGMDIVQTGDPILRARAAEVNAADIDSDAMRELVDAMVATMRAAPGVGLAAPQIGVPLRVIVVEDRAELMQSLSAAERQERRREAYPLCVVINPVLRPVGAE